MLSRSDEMNIAYRLTLELRRKLKDPIGTLIPGSFSETMNRLKEVQSKKKNKMIISVGDTVTRNLVKNGLTPKVSIIDNIAMRKKTEPILQVADKTIRVVNPRGTITAEAIETIRESLASNINIRIVIDGEEDLLALVAILYAPEDAVVVYGQPHQGIVVVDVTKEKKAAVKAMLTSMEGRKTK
jgi:uncharacterized protein (UPF0218 family)